MAPFIADGTTDILRASGGGGGAGATAAATAGGACGYGDGDLGNARGAGGATTGGAGVSSTLGPGPGGGGSGGGISTTNMVRTGGTGAYGHLSGSVGRRANQVTGAAAGLGGNGGSNKAGR